MRRHNRESGIALLTVLWVVVLFSAVAVSYAYGLRAETRMTRNQLDRAAAEALAEAGLARAIQVLGVAGDLNSRYGVTERFPLGDGQVTWLVRNAAGRLNLNTASGSQLREFFTRFDVDDGQAAALADAVLDWRDSDDLRRIDGAEDNDYRVSERPYGAADALFRHPAELQQVLGMDPGLYARVSPHLTVHGRHRGINPRHADGDLLRRFGSEDPEAIEAYLTRRASAPDLAQPPLVVTTDPFSNTFSAYVVIQAQGRTATGITAQMEALADIGTGRIVDWQMGQRREGGAR